MSTQPVPAREFGTVSWFNEKKRFGFIWRDCGNFLYFNINSFKPRSKMPRKGDRISFRVRLDGLSRSRYTRLRSCAKA